MTTLVLVICVFWLAYSNGANDNFKGVATLYGSATADYPRALRLATIATICGSVLSLVLASELARTFTGDDLVPPELAGHASLLISVAAGAAVTILLATFLGMPTSTTHALTGALHGVSVVVGGWDAPGGRLWSAFLIPLLVSPPLAILGAFFVYPVLSRIRRDLGVSRATCVCFGPRPAPAMVSEAQHSGLLLKRTPPLISFDVARTDECAVRYQGNVVGLGAQTLVNGLHYASATAVCFARAVNDTPKIAALLLAAGVAGGAHWSLALVAAAMAAGGWLNSRRVAEIMSRRITDLNPGQGLTGNLLTAALVLGASRLGMPVSTTHVSCGALFGIGLVTGAARWRTIGAILFTWITTLPCGAVLGAGVFLLLTRSGVL